MATASSVSGAGNINAFDSIAQSLTDSILVAAVPNKRIRVVAFMVNQGDTTPSTVTFNSKGSGSGTSVFPALKYAANGGTSVPVCPSGWFQTNLGEGLSVTTGAGSTTGVAVVYEVVS